ncbi:MAG: DNA repair protein RadA [Chlamydiales bacterium]
MASTKTKKEWGCIECGHTQPKWTGSCPMCQAWNTLKEMVIHQEVQSRFETKSAKKPVRVNEVSTEDFERDFTKIGELDRLFGGGVVAGSLSLLGGQPGIGKSTLLLQLAQSFAAQGKKVLYVCGEESEEQTSMRARRLGVTSENLYLFSETLFSRIKVEIDNLKPDLLIIDSVQIVYKAELASLPGSVSQVREIAMECMHLAKRQNITTFLIGHVTKSGEIAGPRVLEHLVDTVLEFEGDRQHGYRILRSIKNRFGPTDDIALFQMENSGLKEVANPSELFLQERMGKLPGSVISATIEGSRAILVEAQALVAPSSFSTSTRRQTGMDQNRLSLLLAVLEKRLGYQLYNLDVFVSIAGGLRINEPAIDLAILLAIASSFRNLTLPSDLIVIGEVGLGGEVRSVPRIEARIKEAIQMGFTRAVVPKKNLKSLKSYAQKIRLTGVERVEEAVEEGEKT